MTSKTIKIIVPVLIITLLFVVMIFIKYSDSKKERDSIFYLQIALKHTLDTQKLETMEEISLADIISLIKSTDFEQSDKQFLIRKQSLIRRLKESTVEVSIERFGNKKYIKVTASALDLCDLNRNKKCGLDFNPGLQKDYNKPLQQINC